MIVVFLSLLLIKQTGSACNFLQLLIQVCRGSYIHYFKINAPIFCCPSRNYSFQQKPFFLETIGLQQKSFYRVETVPFNGRHCLCWRLFLLLEAIHFSGNLSFQWKPVEVLSDCGSHSFQGKLLFFLEIITRS